VTTNEGLVLTHEISGYRELVNSWYNTTNDVIATAMWVANKANLTQKSALKVTHAVLDIAA